MPSIVPPQNPTPDFHAYRHNYLSYSQIAEWLQCHYKWAQRYHLGLITNVDARPLVLGDAVHQAIAAYFLEGVDPETTVQTVIAARRDRAITKAIPTQLADAQSAELDEVESIAPSLVSRLLAYLEELEWSPVYLEDGRPCIELDLKMPIRHFTAFTGHIDAIFHDRRRDIIRLVDWKVRRTFMPDEAEQSNLQHALYMNLCRYNGIPVEGTVTFEIRNALPSKPKRNKDGSISRTAIATDWETYRLAVIEAGLDPSNYLDMEAKLADYRFFNPLHSYRTQAELDTIWSSIVEGVADEINAEKKRFKHDRGHVPIRSMKHLNCQSCQYREICTQSLSGYDLSPVISAFFSELPHLEEE